MYNIFLKSVRIRSEQCEPVHPLVIADPGLGLLRLGSCRGTWMVLTALVFMMRRKKKLSHSVFQMMHQMIQRKENLIDRMWNCIIKTEALWVFRSWGVKGQTFF